MDLLIVSPLNLKFQAPFLHTQKRLLTLMNASDETLIYNLNLSNVKDYSVDVPQGKVLPFDTTELAITLQPVCTKDLPLCLMEVKYLIEAQEANNWLKASTTKIAITLDSADQLDDSLRLRLPHSQDMVQLIEENYRQQCALIKLPVKKQTKMWWKRGKWLMFLLVLGGAAYYCFGPALSPKSEQVY